ncbi:MAG: OmpA family protein [Bacteroidota bacterium]|nr:OmpA family protein [Bacteroidota bacterium]
MPIEKYRWPAGNGRWSNNLVLVLFPLFLLSIFSTPARTFAQEKKLPKKQNLGRLINSPYSEIAPIISPNGKLLFFTMGIGNPYNQGEDHLQDCYVSKFQSGAWGKPKNLGIPINSPGNDAICGVSPDGQVLFLKNFYYNHVSGLCFAQRTPKGTWQIDPITIESYANSNQFSSQCISTNGQFIILSIEQAGGYGGLDLYVSRLKDRKKNLYGPPESLGPVINTKENDFAPFLAPDGKTLYYSTSGKGGYGNADVFITKRLDDSWVNWTAPQNMGPQINTSGMDAYYSIPASGDVAYFSSSNGENQLDLYKIALTEDQQPFPVTLLSGRVTNRKGEPLNATIVCTDIVQNLEVGRSSTSEETDVFSMVLPAGQHYRFNVESPGYLPFSDEIDLSQQSGFSEPFIDIVLDSIAIGSVTTIGDIFFDFNKATLKPESAYSLDRLAGFLKLNSDWIVEIQGHTDSIGTAEFNNKLSLERAQSVVAYLLGKGIEEKRLRAEGFGAMNPVAENTTDEGRRKNRRVAFRIVGLQK